MIRGKKILGALLAFTLCFSMVIPAQADDISDAKKKQQELEQQKNTAEAEKSELSSELDSIVSKMEKTQSDLTAKETEINDAETELVTAKANEDDQYQTMKLRIKYMYENGQNNLLDMVMESGSISELLNRAEYVSQIAEYDRKMLTAYASAKEQMAAREQNLEKEHGELLVLQESTQAKQASMQKLMDSKQKELDSYNSKIAMAQDELDQHNADIKAQEEQMRRIEAEMKRREEEARKKAEAAGKTYTVSNLGNISFKWPCPSSSRITSNFGDRESPTEGASSNHKGIDISASTGADIIAAADGEVVISTYSYSAGNYIMLDHGGGVSTVYMHCSKLLVGVGEKVTKGQVIAKVGSTGYSTGSHLHFGIRSGGTYVNPRSYVSP